MRVKRDARFGYLRVLRAGHGRASCKCDCGQTIKTSNKELLHGQTSCGCQPKGSNPPGRIRGNLEPGAQVGRLTLVRVDRKRSPILATCQCTCGRTHTISYRVLKRGEVESCGCPDP